MAEEMPVQKKEEISGEKTAIIDKFSISSLKEGWKGLLIAAVIGVVAYLIQKFTGYGVLDPLLIALVIGVVIRSFVKFDDESITSFKLAPLILIPIGVIFYGAKNLDFVKFASVDITYILLLLAIVIVYVTSAILLSNAFGIREKISYLIAAGSAICGASAIAIASPAVEAEPDDVSISLLSVFISALIGLFVVLPLLTSVFGLGEQIYAELSGSVLQFTGFVKVAVSNMPDEIASLALSVKAARYMGLLILIPLFSSFARNKFYIPWYLWAFLGAGLLFTFVPALGVAKPYIKMILTVLWSIAMAAIGLNANIKAIFTNQGLKTLAVSFISFILAVGVFLLGTTYIL